MQVPDQASNAESAPLIQPFAQVPSQDVEVVLDLPEQQRSNMNQAQEETEAASDLGTIPYQAEQREKGVTETGKQQNEDPILLMHPMVAKLCQLLTQYNIQVMPPQMGDKACTLSLTCPNMPEIRMSIRNSELYEEHAAASP
jgi:hypothetical protein